MEPDPLDPAGAPPADRFCDLVMTGGVTDGVLYPWYADGPRPWPIDVHADQVLGGLVMWVGAGFYLLCVLSAVFFRWARHEDRDEPAIGRPPLAVVGRKAG